MVSVSSIPVSVNRKSLIIDMTINKAFLDFIIILDKFNSIEANSFRDITKVSKLTLETSADFLDVCGVEMITNATLEVSVNGNRVSRAFSKGITQDTFRNETIVASVPFNFNTDFLDISCVEVITPCLVPVSVDWDSLSTWLDKEFKGNTFTLVAVLSDLTWSDSSHFIGVIGVHMVGFVGVPISVDLDKVYIWSNIILETGFGSFIICNNTEECSSFRLKAIFSNLSSFNSTDFSTIRSVEVISFSCIPVSVNGKRVLSVFSQSITNDTFADISIVANSSLSGGTYLIRVGSVEMISASTLEISINRN
mmetsp:Transcript_16463/g.14188  ORF Transcript_16463/g.14188 Transcript_16463/m.14188 type:complete len:309 (+) Transcript_16463:1384-2310(+)